MTRYTPRHALPAPEGQDPVLTSDDIWALAAKADTVMAYLEDNLHRRFPVETKNLLDAGLMYLQRSGHTITVTLNGAKMQPGSTLIAELPSGYRNEIRYAYGFTGRTGTGLPASFEIINYDQIHQHTTHEGPLYGVLQFQTNQEYPV